MPNTDTSAIRTATRRIKTHIANKYLKLADRVDDKGEGDLTENESAKYWELTKEFARNVVPRSQEISGDDGGPLEVTVIKYANGDTASAQIPAENLPASDTASV
jgi:hypothetical protein